MTGGFSSVIWTIKGKQFDLSIFPVLKYLSAALIGSCLTVLTLNIQQNQTAFISKMCRPSLNGSFKNWFDQELHSAVLAKSSYLLN